MKIMHKVKINVDDQKGNKQQVLQSGHISLPKRLLTFLFGDCQQVLVLIPGESVEGIVIQEVGNGGGHND